MTRGLRHTRSLLILFFILFAVVPAATGGEGAYKAKGSVHAEEVEYTSSGVTMKGFLAYDGSIKGKRPGVLVVHEWWGHNDYARRRALMLAELGYTALAVDMYGDGKVAAHPEDAGRFSSEVGGNIPLMTERFNRALKFLKGEDTVDEGRVGAIGYCFGGTVVLHMVRGEGEAGSSLKGVASFHGGLGPIGTAAYRGGRAKAKVFVAHGGEDNFTPPERVLAFREEMEDLGFDLDFKVYPGAPHSFTNPAADEYAERFNIPLGYSEEADRASWMDLKNFLEDIFK